VLFMLISNCSDSSQTECIKAGASSRIDCTKVLADPAIGSGRRISSTAAPLVIEFPACDSRRTYCNRMYYLSDGEKCFEQWVK